MVFSLLFIFLGKFSTIGKQRKSNFSNKFVVIVYFICAFEKMLCLRNKTETFRKQEYKVHIAPVQHFYIQLIYIHTSSVILIRAVTYIAYIIILFYSILFFGIFYLFLNRKGKEYQYCKCYLCTFYQITKKTMFYYNIAMVYECIYYL